MVINSESPLIKRNKKRKINIVSIVRPRKLEKGRIDYFQSEFYAKNSEVHNSGPKMGK